MTMYKIESCIHITIPNRTASWAFQDFVSRPVFSHSHHIVVHTGWIAGFTAVVAHHRGLVLVHQSMREPLLISCKAKAQVVDGAFPEGGWRALES